MCETYLSVASSQLLTWLSLSLLLTFAPPHMYYCCIIGNNVGKKRNPTSSLPSHGIMASHNRMQGHKDRGEKKSCQNIGRQKCQVKLG